MTPCGSRATFPFPAISPNQSPAAAQPGPNAMSTLPGYVTQNGAASTTPGTPRPSKIRDVNGLGALILSEDDPRPGSHEMPSL
jgi:hypothetical protein